MLIGVAAEIMQPGVHCCYVDLLGCMEKIICPKDKDKEKREEEIKKRKQNVWQNILNA
jgi:hypothetical protein